MADNHFCTNCGSPIDPNAAICVKCGFAKGVGKKYCANCGNAIPDENAAICLSCGYPLSGNVNTAGNTNTAENSGSFGGNELIFGKRATGNEQVGQKSQMVAGLLYIFLSGIGIGDFYLGYTKTAVIRIVLTFIGMWIFGLGIFVNLAWAIVMAVNVFSGKTLDAQGFALKK